MQFATDVLILSILIRFCTPKRPCLALNASPTGDSANENRIDVFDEMLSVVIAVLGVVLNDPGVGGVDRDPGSKNIGVLKIPDVA